MRPAVKHSIEIIVLCCLLFSCSDSENQSKQGSVKDDVDPEKSMSYQKGFESVILQKPETKHDCKKDAECVRRYHLGVQAAFSTESK